MGVEILKMKKRIKNYPIILAHGICPFDKVIRPFGIKDNSDDDRNHYFRGIRSHLISKGFLVFHSRVSWGGPLKKRAKELREVILRITGNFKKWDKVHIIGHSMGGLDARLMVYKYKMHEHILSITTIGTPHWGSSYADWGLKRMGALIWFFMMMGLDIRGFRNLTTKACAELNLKLRDFEKNNGVIYRTVAGWEPYERLFKPLRFPYKIINRYEGKNDGLVSVKSATWRDEYLIEVIEADHLNQIGWWNKEESLSGLMREEFENKIREFYLRLVMGLLE